MNNTNALQNQSFAFANSAVAVTAILVIGVCYCTTITVNAKYNRDTELTYKEFSLKIHALS